MNRNERIAQIKEQLKSLFKLADTPTTTEISLQDGTKLIINDTELKVGAEISKLDENGEPTPVDNGDYVLEDGRTITIQDGKVSDIKDAASVEASEEADLADAPQTTPNSELEARVAELENQVNEILEMLQTMNSVNKELSNQNELLMSKVEEFSKEPGADAIVTRKPEIKSKETLAKDEILLLRELAKK